MVEGGQVFDLRSRGQAQTVGETGNLLRPIDGDGLVHRAIDPHVERRTVDQSGELGIFKIGSAQPIEQPGGSYACGCCGFLFVPIGAGPWTDPVESHRNLRVICGQREHCGATRDRTLANHADGGVDKVAHRTPVLRSSIATAGEIPRDQRIRRRAGITRGLDDLVEQFDRGLGSGGGCQTPLPLAGGVGGGHGGDGKCCTPLP